MDAKPISIKSAGGKSGGCALKAVELTSGDLPCVVEPRLRAKRFTLTARQESAEGIVAAPAAKARTERERRVVRGTRWAASGRRTSYRWCWPSPSRGGGKLRTLGGKGPKRSRRNASAKARLSQSK